MLYIGAVREPSPYSLEEWDWAPFTGLRRVQFQKHDIENKKAQCSEVPTEVQTDIRTQQTTGVESVKLLWKELRSLRTLIRVRRQLVPTKVD